MVVLLEVFEPMLFEPAGKSALKQEFRPVVKIYPAVAMDKIPEKSKDIIWQRNDLLFEHLFPQCLFRCLPHSHVRILFGNLRKESLDCCSTLLFYDLDGSLTHAPMRI